MRRMRCEDIVFSIMEETERKGVIKSKNMIRDVSRSKELQCILADIDSLSSEFDGKGYDICIDTNGDIHISLICEEAEVSEKKHIFYKIASSSISFGFSAAEDNDIKVNFVLPGIWKKA